MKEPFELQWLGGFSEQYMRRVRPGIDEFPWGTLRLDDYPPLLVDRARVSWTEAAFNEYCTAAAMADMIAALLAAKAPIDLVCMAADFVTDEMLHVELTARIAMELGGGAPYEIDFSALSPQPDPRLTPLQQANELVVRVCCVGEAFSVPMLGGCRKSATHPLTHAVLDKIVRDEAPHGRFGWLYLDWIAEDLDDAERERLAAIALQTLWQFQPYWQRLRSKVTNGVTTEGFLLSHVRELGWMEAQAYRVAAIDAVRGNIVVNLRKYGIPVDEAEVDRLLAV